MEKKMPCCFEQNQSKKKFLYLKSKSEFSTTFQQWCFNGDMSDFKFNELWLFYEAVFSVRKPPFCTLRQGEKLQ